MDEYGADDRTHLLKTSVFSKYKARKLVNAGAVHKGLAIHAVVKKANILE